MMHAWMGSLIETYDQCISDPRTRSESTPLVPICHTINNAQITVTLSEDGEFISAYAVPKEDQRTIIPCTESSAGRTSGPSPHPLDDKLIYLVEDFQMIAGEPVSNSFKPSHRMYMEQLRDWMSHDPANIKLASICKYLEGGTLVQDLVLAGILAVGEDGVLLKKAESPESPLFSISKIPNEQSEAFIRWSVVTDDPCINTWEDESMISSWISFVRSKMEDVGLCYVTGEMVPLAQNHPSKIRSTGDGAKIISSNDTTYFTFRGRFETSDQAYGIGFEATQKMHSALRWLIGRQGYCNGDLCIVAWTNAGDVVPSPVSDPMEQLGSDDDSNEAWTNTDAALRIRTMLRGYNSRILDRNVAIMGLDSAMGAKGRLAVIFFREQLGEDFVERLETWHGSCAWIHRYGSVKGDDGKNKHITFIGAPSPKDIAQSAYGRRADEKIVSTVLKRIVPCILDGDRIPFDIMESVVRRASNPVSMDKWEWEKTLSIACSVFKQYSGGKYELTLEKDRRSRDYLYGRLLAVADLMEGAALKDAGENRQTTAMRMMQRFSEMPYSTWRDIELALVPYAARLGSKAGYYEMKIAEIMDMFEGDDFRDNSKLSGEFLLAYHCQREDQFRKKEDKNKTEEEEVEE